jgi:hypothetical protein
MRRRVRSPGSHLRLEPIGERAECGHDVRHGVPGGGRGDDADPGRVAVLDLGGEPRLADELPAGQSGRTMEGSVKKHTPEDDWTPKTPKSRPAARYNLSSIGAPFLGDLASFAFLCLSGAVFDGWPDWTTHTRWAAGVGMAILAASCLIGLASACVAIARRERHRGLTVLGLILNAPLPLLLLRTGLENLLGWLHYG